MDLKKIKKTCMIESTWSQYTTDGQELTIQEESLCSFYAVDLNTYILSFDRYIGSDKYIVTMAATSKKLIVTEIGDYTQQRYAYETGEWYAFQSHYYPLSFLLRNYTEMYRMLWNADGCVIEVLHQLWNADQIMANYRLKMVVK